MADRKRPRSTFCCSITPFAKDGSLDEAGLRHHLARLGDAGVGVYLAGSSPGEGYTLSRDEMRRCLEIGVEELAGRVPVRAMGVEPRSAEEMVAFISLAESAGVDAVQIYSLDVGHGGRPTDAALEAYFRRALEATALPCVVSSHHFIGYTLPPELMRRLTDAYPHLVGFNVTSPDVPYMTRIAEALHPRTEVHVGGPMHTLTGLALGFDGFLSTEANLAPRLCQSVVALYDAGALSEAASAYRSVMRIMTTMGEIEGQSVRYLKAALDVLGLPGSTLRDPNLPVNEDEWERVRRRLDGLGIDELGDPVRVKA